MGRGPEGTLLPTALKPDFPILSPTDCVVLASSPDVAEKSHLLQLRVQGKEKHQMLEVSLPRVSRGAGSLCPLPRALRSLVSVGGGWSYCPLWSWVPTHPR